MNDIPEMLTLAGVSAVVLAAIAWIGDRRRMRRNNLDKVGLMPWTSLFFWALLAAIVLLGLAAQAWIGGAS